MKPKRKKCINCKYRELKKISKKNYLYGCFSSDIETDLCFDGNNEEKTGYFDSKFTNNRKGNCPNYEKSFTQRIKLFFLLRNKNFKTPRQL